MTSIPESEMNFNDVLLHPYNIDDAENYKFVSLRTGALENNELRKKEEEESDFFENYSLDGQSTGYASPQFGNENMDDVFCMVENGDVADRILMDALKSNPTGESSFPTFFHNPNDKCSQQNLRSAKVSLALEHHIGNNRFYIKLSIFRQKFMEAFHLGNRDVCNEILKQIINSVCYSDPPGRFLECNHYNEGWTDIGKGSATMRTIEAALFQPPSVALSEFLYHEHDIEGALLKSDNRSSAMTWPIDYSKTVSLASIRGSSFQGSYASSYMESSFMTESQFENDTSILSTFPEPADEDMEYEKPDRIKKKKGMRRRGLISSDVPKSETDKIGSSMYGIGKDLETLVQSVFDQPIESESSTGDFDLASAYSYTSEDLTGKRMKQSVGAQSVCSSTSSLGGLRAEFANNFIIDSNITKAVRRRKVASINKAHVASSDSGDCYPRIKVQYLDESTGAAQLRSLSSYDVLCTNKVSPFVRQCNHVGNNRLRTMFMIHQSRYNSKDASVLLKNCVVHDILQHILHGTKAKAHFVFQHQERSNLWIQIPNEAVPKIIVTCLECCSFDPSFYILPAPTEKEFLYNSRNRRDRKITMTDLHKCALGNIRRRKMKKAISGRDGASIRHLQDSVRKNAEGKPSARK
jgi:hypothetical protein